MGEVDEVQEWTKVDIEALKEKMAIMMEAVMSMKKMMEVNATVVAVTSAVAEVDPTPPSSLNQINHAILDMVGQRGKELGSTGGPHFVQVQNKHSFPPYGLAPNHTPPNATHTPNKDVDSSAPIPIESQQPQTDHAHVSQPMGETHEIPHHNLTNFEPRLGYATEEQAIGGVPLPNTLEIPQFLPQPQSLHFAAGRIPLAMAEKGKLDHIEERLRVVEGGGSYAFADMSELCLVSGIAITSKFKVPDFNKYKGTTCLKNHLKMYCKKMRAYTKDGKLLMHFFQESLTGAAVTWYTNQKPSRIYSSKDLRVAFIRQYQYNSDMALDRTQLQNMCKREHKSFKGYAQR